MAFADRADAVLARIREELALPMSDRESAATDEVRASLPHAILRRF